MAPLTSPRSPLLAAFIAPKDQLFYGFLKPWLGEWVLGDGGTGGAAPMGAPQTEPGVWPQGTGCC